MKLTHTWWMPLFFLGKAAEKVVILLISLCQWYGRDRTKVPAHSFPHSCPIPLCLCATAYAPGSKFRGIPCSITWIQSNRSSLWKVTAVFSFLLHKNGFQRAPINNVLHSHSCWSSHCTNISCIDGNWHNHSSQTTTANLSVLLGSAIGKHKSRAFGANLLVICSIRAFSNLWRHAKYLLGKKGSESMTSPFHKHS